MGYNHKSDGYVTNAAFGQITVSVIFRPVSSVAKSGMAGNKSNITVNNYFN